MSSHPGDQGRACRDLEPRGDPLSVVPGEAAGPYGGPSVKAGATQCPAQLMQGLAAGLGPPPFLTHYREHDLVIQRPVTLSLGDQHLSSNWDISGSGRGIINTGPRLEPGTPGKIQDQVTPRARPGPGVQGDTVTVDSGPKRIQFTVIPSD